MSPENDLEQLRRDVQYLMDRQAILDCIARHAHGHDRHDVEGYAKGTRDKRDLSYQRPLSLDETPERW